MLSETRDLEHDQRTYTYSSSYVYSCMAPLPADVPLPGFQANRRGGRRKRYWHRRFTEDMARPWWGGYLAIVDWGVRLLRALYTGQARLAGKYPPLPILRPQYDPFMGDPGATGGLESEGHAC